MARAKVAALATVSALVAVLLAEILAALVAPSTRVTRDILGRRPIEVTPGLYREMVHDGQAYTDLQPGARGRHRLLNDYDVALRFSQLGTRSPDLGPREPGEFRVLILGDSQTFGHGVAEESTFVNRLQDLLRADAGAPVRVINGGVAGYGTYEALWKLERLAPVVQPDLVLAVVFADNALVPDEGNDLWNNVERAARREATGATPALPSTRLRTPVRPPARARLRFLADHSHLYGLLSLLRRKLRGVPSHVEQVRSYGQAPGEGQRLAEAWEEVRRVLNEMATVARTGDARFAVVYLPGLASLLIQDRGAMAELERAGYPLLPLFVALEDALQGDPMRLRFRNDSHYNAFAHGVIAAELRAGLVREKLLPWVSAEPPSPDPLR